jgi:hypothetical protein
MGKDPSVVASTRHSRVDQGKTHADDTDDESTQSVAEHVGGGGRLG